MVLKLCNASSSHTRLFENDVEMYGAQTTIFFEIPGEQFENDVEMYGAQTFPTLL